MARTEREGGGRQVFSSTDDSCHLVVASRAARLRLRDYDESSHYAAADTCFGKVRATMGHECVCGSAVRALVRVPSARQASHRRAPSTHAGPRAMARPLPAGCEAEDRLR